MQKDTTTIEQVLKSQPLVSSATVETRAASDGNNDCVAFVTLHAADEKNVMHAEKEKVRQWAKVYDIGYAKNIDEIDPEFNTAIWTSNYTDDPIPQEQMKEWVATTVQRILELRPDPSKAPAILEIGCGTGLLLYSLLPHLSRYVGIDNSEEAVQLIQRTCAGKKNSEHVKLFVADADDLSALPPDQFDIIVINSVAQYFPSVEYLISVISGLKRFIHEHTRIFIGDVNCYPLLEAFQAETQLSKADAGTPVEKLQATIQKLRKTNGRETFFDPRLFHLLPKQLQWIKGTETRLRKGHFYNEMNNFRFDVILKCSISGQTPSTPFTQLDWKKEGLTPEKLKVMLESNRYEHLNIVNIPNARTQRSAILLDLLKSETLNGTVEQLRIRLEQEIKNQGGIEPEQLWNLSKAPYQLEVDWDYEHWNGYMSLRCVKNKHGLYVYPGHQFLITESSNRPAIVDKNSGAHSELQQHINKEIPESLRPKEVFIISPQMYSLFKN